ncbi:DUF2231 domain-containing protein [Nocardia goodfellowii]|uniref:Membrane protein n=1 Tax=Nocardia goodfellowii TaxID=882446 RepID=A0ABS4QD73_9NOCA|nr:DUF2231 domain-containing protein [Nocardia goodfellowii]MBP2189523.1 putative membrane protein [Nocardia goodfellowii]
MSTIDGLPAHVLLVHVIVVFVPLTALSLVLCAVWPAARRRLIWPAVALAAITAALTPVTIIAGANFATRFGPSEALQKHTDLGGTMNYFAVPLLLAAAALLVVFLREQRGKPLAHLLIWVIAVLTIGASVAATVQVYRVGESGSRAVWGQMM